MTLPTTAASATGTRVEVRAPQISSGYGSVIVQWLPPRWDGGTPILHYQYCLEPIFRCDNLWVEIRDSAPSGANHGRYEITRANGAYTIVDEGEETLTLSNASGARIRDAEATGTIVNSDPLPRAWLARFGRTAAGHVLDAVGERLAARSGDAQVTVAGRRLSTAPGADTAAYDDPLEGWEEPGTLQLAELVGGSSFHLAAASGLGADALDTGAGGSWTVWGRGGWTRFAGSEDRLSLDGEVITATVGADYEQDRLLAGLAVAYSSGDGTFEHASGRSGEVHATLTSVHPYVRLKLRASLRH